METIKSYEKKINLNFFGNISYKNNWKCDAVRLVNKSLRKLLECFWTKLPQNIQILQAKMWTVNVFFNIKKPEVNTFKTSPNPPFPSERRTSNSVVNRDWPLASNDVTYGRLASSSLSSLCSSVKEWTYLTMCSSFNHILLKTKTSFYAQMTKVISLPCTLLHKCVRVREIKTKRRFAISNHISLLKFKFIFSPLTVYQSFPEPL